MAKDSKKKSGLTTEGRIPSNPNSGKDNGYPEPNLNEQHVQASSDPNTHVGFSYVFNQAAIKKREGRSVAIIPSYGMFRDDNPPKKPDPFGVDDDSTGNVAGNDKKEGSKTDNNNAQVKDESDFDLSEAYNQISSDPDFHPDYSLVFKKAAEKKKQGRPVTIVPNYGQESNEAPVKKIEVYVPPELPTPKKKNSCCFF